MNRYRILLIDDDEDGLAVLSHYLDLSGYMVDSAQNGIEGLAALDRNRPDLVLLDVQMPIMDGFRTMEAIRTRPELSDLPVLFLTSLNQGHLKVKGLELGAEDFITKPYNKAELVARVRAALRRSRRYREDSAALHGNLSHMSLAELLQTFDLGRRTAHVMLPDIDGEVVVHEGALAGVRQGRFDGENALHRLFLLERGAFRVSFELPATLDGPRRAVQAAMMDALTCLDEVRAALRAICHESTMVDLDQEARAAEPWKSLAELLPMPLATLAALLPGSLRDNAAQLVEAHEQGHLKPLR